MLETAEQPFQTQLALIRGAEPPRPCISDDSYCDRVAKVLCDLAVEGGEKLGPDTESELAEWLRNNRGNGVGWNRHKDRAMSRVLPFAGRVLLNLHRHDVRKWVAEWDIQPRHSIGDLVCVSGLRSGDVGEIVEIRRDLAEYAVLAKSRIIGSVAGVSVPYEKIVPLPEVKGAA